MNNRNDSKNNSNDIELSLAAQCDANAEEYGGVGRAQAFGGMWDNYYRTSYDYPHNYSRAPSSPAANITVKPEYNLADYNYYRPSESSPQAIKSQMWMAMQAYEKVPIVRNVMDMMADFTVDGIRIVHRDRSKMNVLNKWADKVNFHYVSERIAHMLYTLGNAPVRILEGPLNLRVETDWKKAKASDDIKLGNQKIKPRVIPLGYKLFNPLTLEVIGGDIATYVGEPIYGLRLSQKMKVDMKKLEQLAIQQEQMNELFKRIPDNLKMAVKGGHQIVPLDQNKIKVLFYKKNDWQTWAVPLLSCIFKSLALLEKLHLADSSALDGAISQIRLWKLGIYNTSNPQHSILPKAAAINKLRNVLSNLGTGVLDLVWGPELDFVESSSQVHQFLGSDKYGQVMTEIYSGLGVPQTLTGQANKGGGNTGFSNNAISMKTLIERLEYGRRILIKFWNDELIKVQKALGWRFPGIVTFDRTVLADEAAEKKIILDLWDREIISNQTVLELSGRDPELEILRVQNESRKRENKKMPPKASPYHTAQTEHELRKIILQGGGVCPSEVGLELEEKKDGEVCRVEQQGKLQLDLAEKNNDARLAQVKAKPKSPGGDGRPKNSKDKQPRKQRKDKPKTVGESFAFVDLFMWGVDAQAQLTDVISPAYLSHINKKNLRSLTKKEFDEFESFKFGVFARMEPYCKVNEENVYNIIKDKEIVDPDLVIAKEVLLKCFEDKNENKPTVEELRQIQASAYALQYENKGNYYG